MAGYFIQGVVHVSGNERLSLCTLETKCWIRSDDSNLCSWASDEV